MRIPVLDHGDVSLIETWGSDARIIEAARMSTGKGFTGWGTPAAPGDEKLLAYLYRNHHATPFEMAGLVIEVNAPIFVFREWHRHRTQSYNEMSARYIPLPNVDYVPSVETIAARSGANVNRQASGSSACSEAQARAWRDELIDLYQHAQRIYARGLALGVPKELARLPLPVARYSRMRASANLRNWLAFLTLRTAPAAQWEIRQYANAVGELIAAQFPRTWALFAAAANLPTATQQEHGDG
jgi:thymidylate synthase (FAD)